jgi:hypothetical protein
MELLLTRKALKLIHKKLAGLYVMFWAAKNSSGAVALPRRPVCKTLKLRPARFADFVDHLLRLNILRDDFSYDNTPGQTAHYIFNDYAATRIPQLLDNWTEAPSLLAQIMKLPLTKDRQLMIRMLSTRVQSTAKLKPNESANAAKAVPALHVSPTSRTFP